MPVFACKQGSHRQNLADVAFIEFELYLFFHRTFHGRFSCSKSFLSLRIASMMVDPNASSHPDAAIIVARHIPLVAIDGPHKSAPGCDSIHASSSSVVIEFLQ
jgi:hypothetical protein